MTQPTTATSPATRPTTWVDVCALSDLLRERGVAVWLDGEQVALFRTFDDELYGVQNRDPFSAAMVLSRGIVGTRGDAPTVASPMYKQVFDLRTGQCFDDVTVTLRTYPVRVVDGRVEVSRHGASGAVHGEDDPLVRPA